MQRMPEQHEVDASQVHGCSDRAGGARLMLVDDGIGPLDLEVIAKNLPVVRVVVDDQEAQGDSRTRGPRGRSLPGSYRPRTPRRAPSHRAALSRSWSEAPRVRRDTSG